MSSKFRSLFGLLPSCYPAEIQYPFLISPLCSCPLTYLPYFYYLVNVWWNVQFCGSNTFVMFKYIRRDLILSVGRNTLCHTYAILHVLYALNRLPDIGRVKSSVLRYLAIFPKCQDEERTFFIVDVCRRTWNIVTQFILVFLDDHKTWILPQSLMTLRVIFLWNLIWVPFLARYGWVHILLRLVGNVNI